MMMPAKAAIQRVIVSLALIFVAISSLHDNAAAQSVTVQNGLGEYGYGWMFAHSGICYAVMPKHVAGPFPRVTITTASPVAVGTGAVLAPFWEGVDLAVAVARGGLEGSCTTRLDDLQSSPATRGATSADLLRLTPDGMEDRSKLHIGDRSYLTFSGTIEEAERQIAQGTSGAFAFVDGKPIGMAITSDATDQATFMRAEEIYINVNRFLSVQSGGFTQLPDRADAEPPAASAQALPLVLVSSSVPPINPRHAPENMTGDGVFVFSPQSRNRFVFGFEGEAILPFSRLRITAPSDDETTMPKRILVQYAVDEEGARFRLLMRGQMGPDGVFDTGSIAARNVRFLEITVLDSWAPGNVAIDEVLVE